MGGEVALRNTVPSWMVGCGLLGRPTEGKCRLELAIGLMSSSLTGPPHVLFRASKFTRKLVKSSLGGEVYGLSEMVEHMSALREFYAPFEGIGPEMGAWRTVKVRLHVWRPRR